MGDVPPTATAIPPATVNDGQPIPAIDVASHFTDPNGVPLTLSVSALPKGLSFDPTTGKITGTIDHDASKTMPVGGYPITVTADDGQGGTVTTTFTITSLNQAPAVGTNTPDQSVAAGAPLSVDAGKAFSDPNTNDVITYTASGLPKGLSIDPTTGKITGTPSATASKTGPYSVVVTATDDKGAATSETFTFNVANVPPVATGTLPAKVIADGTSGVAIATAAGFTDTLGNTLTYSATGLPAGLSINPVTGQITGRLDHDASKNAPSVTGANGIIDGKYTIVVTANDGQGGTVTQTFTLDATNQAPVVATPTPNQNSSAGRVVTLDTSKAFVDPNVGDVLKFSASGLPKGLSINSATGKITGTLDRRLDVGTYTIAVIATDDKGAATTETFVINVLDIVPVATNDVAGAQPGASVNIPVLANDYAGGESDYPNTVVSATTTNGTVAINPNGTLDFNPGSDFAGVATITYTISDGQGGFATATVRVLVSPNIHVTAPAAPNAPIAGNNAPSNAGIAAEGAVLAAVHAADSMGGTESGLSTGITAAGIVDAAANQISSLGGATTSGGHIDPRDTSPVWRLQNLISERFSHQTETWNPEGLTGFSLRYTFAADPLSTARGQIVLDSMVRDRQLIVNLSHTGIPDHATVVEYRVMQADGRPLPGWLDNSGQNVLMGEHPVDVEVIKLRVIAIMSDGATIERDVVIQTNSGEIQPLKETKRSDATPLFSDQLTTFAERDQAEFDRLLKALAG